MTPMKDMVVLTKEDGASTLACEIWVKLGFVVDRGCVCSVRFGMSGLSHAMWRTCGGFASDSRRRLMPKYKVRETRMPLLTFINTGNLTSFTHLPSALAVLFLEF